MFSSDKATVLNISGSLFTWQTKKQKLCGSMNTGECFYLIMEGCIDQFKVLP